MASGNRKIRHDGIRESGAKPDLNRNAMCFPIAIWNRAPEHLMNFGQHPENKKSSVHIPIQEFVQALERPHAL